MKGFLNGDESFRKGGFRTYQPEKGAGNDFNPHKGRGKDQKRARKVLLVNLDFQPRKHPVKKDMAMPGNQTIGLPASGLTILVLWLLHVLARELILRGWWHPL